MSEVKVNKVSPRSGTTVTIGDSGDTINIVGTLQNNGSPLAGDISSVVAGTGLSGGATSGVATLNIEAAQPTITSLGTITGFTSTGIDDNADATAITIDSSERVLIKTTDVGYPGFGDTLTIGSASGNNGMTLRSGTSNYGTFYFSDATGTGTGAYAGKIQYNHSDNSMRIATNSADRMVILSDGKIGIGTTTPNNFNASANQLVVGSGSGDNGITIFAGTSNNSSLFLADGTTATNGYRGSINYLHNGDALTFHANATETMRLTNGNVGIGTSAPAVTLDVRATSFTPYNTNTSLIVEAPAVFSQSQHFYMYNAGAYNSSRPTGGIGSVNASSLISLSAGSICNANPGADGFKATATTSSLYDIGSGNHEFKTKTGLTVGDQFTHQTRMIIKDSGNVGIGTTNPQQPLDISSNGPKIRLSDTSISNLHHIIASEANDLEISCDASGVDANSHIRFKVDGSEKVRFDTSGNVLVGKTATNEDNAGIELQPSGRLIVTKSPNILGVFNLLGNGTMFRFLNTGTLVGSIDVGSSSTSYNTSSDYRLKENVSYDFDATARLKQLKPARFNFIADEDTTVDGFLAHEVSSIVPEAITGTKDAVDDDGNPKYQGIDQSKLVPLLVKTIQELEARITTLENA